MSHSAGIVPRKASTFIAIDFGTHGTGFHYSLDGSMSREPFHDFPDAPRRYPKTLSAILYENKRPVSIGWTARKEFIRSQSSGAPGASSDPCFRLITGFKLLLHDSADPLVQQRPPGVSEVQVIADYLQLFKAFVLDQMRKMQGPVKAHLLAEESTTFIVTVPSKWDDRAKGLMRDACIRAGIIKRAHPERLVMALEPESAALWAKHHEVTRFEPKEVVMVLDAGGGTVDWTIHTVVKRGGQMVLSEAIATRGEMLGSLQLDKAFLDHFTEEVGEQAFNAWKSSHPVELMDVLKQWEGIKCLYGAAADDRSAEHAAHLDLDLDSDMRVSIPHALLASMSAQDRSALLVVHGGEEITLNDEAMRKIFDPTIRQIIDCTNAQLSSADVGVDKVLLVGGFSSSPYMQQRIKAELSVVGSRPEVLTMEQPYAAVMRGAVLFGLNPELIHERKARHSYGVKACGPFQEGSPTKFWNDEEQAFFSESLFCRFVEKGQAVECNETVEHYFIPLYSHQTQAEIEIFIVDAKEARFIAEDDPDTHKVTTLVINLNPGTRPSDRVIRVSFEFGRAEITATATDESTQQKLETIFKFASC